MEQSAYEETLLRLNNAAASAERNASEINLVTVSKTFDAEAILPVLESGARIFGENRVQEAKGKWPALRIKYSDVNVHLIGPLQSNKAAEAVTLFDAIHTIDREKIAKAVSNEITKQQKPLELFVQVNTGSEQQKAGVSSNEAVDFVQLCRDKYHLNISGLMCIPPFDDNPGPHFALLRKLASQCECQKLSMGMSGDFETAIEFGATHIRVGSAIFGVR